MQAKMSRRAFLKADFKNGHQVIRPPWALAEHEFLAHCTQCKQCIEHCESHIITLGNDGYPEIDFTVGECTFCKACLVACHDYALVRVAPPWQVKAEINTFCLNHQQIFCMSCAENCGQHAITFNAQPTKTPQPKIDTDQCNGCGACYNSCPTRAISLCKTLIS